MFLFQFCSVLSFAGWKILPWCSTLMLSCLGAIFCKTPSRIHIKKNYLKNPNNLFSVAHLICIMQELCLCKLCFFASLLQTLFGENIKLLGICLWTVFILWLVVFKLLKENVLMMNIIVCFFSYGKSSVWKEWFNYWDWWY